MLHVPVCDRLGNRYLERQVQGRCGQHALNNVVGGPQFLEDVFIRAVGYITEETGDPVHMHQADGGWYSYEALAVAVRSTIPVMWRLSERPLTVSQYSRFLFDPACVGAIVNIQNRHWTAIVKHDGDLWDVDSLKEWPRLLDEQSFEVLVGQHCALVVESDVSACNIDAKFPQHEGR